MSEELFKPRPYQIPIFDAIENKGYKRVLCIMPRRAGKDVAAFNLIVRAARRKIGTYYYIFPTYAQAKKVIWDAIMNDGQRFLDFIPSQYISSSNSQEMKIKLINGSLIQLVGSDNVDALVGTNPQGIVFSEYAIQDPRAYQFLRPILVANNGWALFISTPRGRNHLYEMYEIAKRNPEWFTYKLTLDDTKHIPKELIDKEIAEGLVSPDLVQQEYYVSFDLGVEGAFYSKALDRMRTSGHLTDVPWDPSHKVNTALDIGVRDSTAIIFFQVIGSSVHIIDCYQNSKEGLDHYVSYIKSKPYIYGSHVAPHDISVREFGTGLTRLEQASQLGIDFMIAPNVSLMDGIEAVRATLARIYIDKDKCQPLLHALESYRQEFDSKNKVYKTTPLHNFASHYADATRYMCLALPYIGEGMTEKDAQDLYNSALYGRQPSTINSPYSKPPAGIYGQFPYK